MPMCKVSYTTNVKNMISRANAVHTKLMHSGINSIGLLALIEVTGKQFAVKFYILQFLLIGQIIGYLHRTGRLNLAETCNVVGGKSKWQRRSIQVHKQPVGYKDRTGLLIVIRKVIISVV